MKANALASAMMNHFVFTQLTPTAAGVDGGQHRQQPRSDCRGVPGPEAVPEFRRSFADLVAYVITSSELN